MEVYLVVIYVLPYITLLAEHFCCFLTSYSVELLSSAEDDAHASTGHHVEVLDRQTDSCPTSSVRSGSKPSVRTFCDRDRPFLIIIQIFGVDTKCQMLT
jgi:hypothetical protein